MKDSTREKIIPLVIIMVILLVVVFMVKGGIEVWKIGQRAVVERIVGRGKIIKIEYVKGGLFSAPATSIEIDDGLVFPVRGMRGERIGRDIIVKQSGFGYTYE